MFCGTLAVAAAGGIFYVFTSNGQPASDFKKTHPLLFVMLMFTLAYFLVYLLGSVAVFLFGILLPLIGMNVASLLMVFNMMSILLFM